MSNHRYSLRRHTPSSHARQATPPPSPRPETLVKSDTSSIKTHHSKREKVKDAIEHFFDKFHHHHHDHHHGSHDEQLTPPTTPNSKRKSFDSRSFKRGGSPTSSLKDRDMVVTVEVPSLSYESSSSTSSLQEKGSDSFEQHASPSVPQVTASPAVIEASSSAVITQEQAPAANEVVEKADDGIEHLPQLEPTSLPSSDEIAEAPTTVEESDRVDEPTETTKESHELPIRHEQREVQEALVASEGSTTLEREAAGSVEPSAADAPTIPAITVTEAEPEINSQQPATESSADVIIAALEESEVTERVTESQAQLSESYVLVETEQYKAPATEASSSNAASVEHPQAITIPDSLDATPTEAVVESHDSSALLKSKATADSSVQADTISHDSSPKPAQPTTTPAVSEQHDAAYSALAKTTAKVPGSYPPASTSASTARASPPRSSYWHTPPSVPLYPELRKVTASMRPKAVKKPSWIRYVYNSFVKPVVSVATDCTVAAICYSLEKLLEARPPALREATSWIV